MHKSKLVMHLNQGQQGSTLVRELVDFPGIQIIDVWLKREKLNERHIVFKEIEFKNIDEAIEAFKGEKNGKICADKT